MACWSLAWLVGAAVAGGARAQALGDLPPAARGLGIEEHLGQPLPLDIDFVNAGGNKVLLGDYFRGNKPAIIVMVYYKCPVVCSAVMDKVAGCLRRLEPTVGKDFNCLVFSFNPLEGPELAAENKEFFLGGYGREVTEQVRAGWEFHVGPAESSRALGNSLGFRYRLLENGEYSHPVAIFIATPEGRISHYLYGFDYPPEDVKLALNEAASGRMTRSIGERLRAFCYSYDPSLGKYTLRATRVMQVAGVLTVLGLSATIGVYIAGERLGRRRRVAATEGAGAASGGTSGESRGGADPSARG